MQSRAVRHVLVTNSVSYTFFIRFSQTNFVNLAVACEYRELFVQKVLFRVLSTEYVNLHELVPQIS